MKTFRVATSRPYDIIIEKNSLQDVAKFIPDRFSAPRKICIITDSTVNMKYADIVTESLKEAGYTTFKLLFPAGEQSKNITTYSNMLDALADKEFTRSDLILALGGGTVGDLAGFVAGSYLRGINFIFVPTTLLAMIDSSLGGKTGINLLGGKNLAGLFWNPSLVLADPTVLDSLQEKTIRDGLAEALKFAVVSDSSLIPHILARNFSYIIDRCISIKKPLVEVDEHDTGLRQLLSFGHTISPAMERMSHYKLSPGQALAKGMLGEAKAAYNSGFCRTDISGELASILEELGFDTEITFDKEALYHTALMDIKVQDGFMTIIVPDVIGKCSIRKITLAELKTFINGLE